ncbi:snRNA-activating protein of 50kDa MW C terminal-domain-containing protein [Melanogaster broomeanus]|nr:snRNA-activating protein of 50kDa MW C terminal-domain-containing protein [Melanogaster broomeanus]
MSVDITRGYDSFFGPPSEPISITEFLNDAAAVRLNPSADGAPAVSYPSWEQLSEDERAAVDEECSASVAELKATVEEVWNNPILSAHLYRMHDAAVNAVLGQDNPPAPKGRKRKRLPVPESNEVDPEVRALQEKLDAISLSCWGLPKESALFMRTSKHSDFNALSRSPSPTSPVHGAPDALITLTVHNRVPWVHSQLTRLSQHAVLASQTLADFIRSIPCDSSEMPAEQVGGEGDVHGYSYGTVERGQDDGAHTDEGCLLLIEGVVYGDGRPGEDYADKLLSHLQTLPAGKRPQITKSPTSLGQTPFASLTTRINQPYWMLHQGNCEHFVVVDQIRLPHPSDPPSGYPLTLHITPALSEVCRACSKVPAVLAIVGDMRLGESPCLFCAPCWRNMGPPRDEDADDVMVVPLVRHRRVWEDGEEEV